jgi:nucleoside-diphosphate-sugar epimerase
MIRWITEHLGTGPALDVLGAKGLSILDVRDLVDKPGNEVSAVAAKIEQGLAALNRGERVVVCCDYGISRSNSIAAGLLAKFEDLGFEHAVRRVMEATGVREIKPGPLAAVRNAVGSIQRAPTLTKNRVLVTGCTGFIGRALSRIEAAGIEWIMPTRDELDLLSGSTQLNLLVTEYAVDQVVHLANPRVYTSNLSMGNTLTMLRNVIEVCVSHDVLMTYLSSWELYSGYVSNSLLADESLPAFPKGPYGETKALAEMLINHARKIDGLKCSVLRPAPIYGLDSDKPKFIYNFIDAARAGRPIITHRYRNGDPALDLIYIDDVISALIGTIQARQPTKLNLGTGALTTTRDVAKIVCEHLGSKVPIQSQAIDTTVASVAMNSGKAKAALDWRPRMGLRDGLEIIVKEYIKRDNQ